VLIAFRIELSGYDRESVCIIWQKKNTTRIVLCPCSAVRSRLNPYPANVENMVSS